MQRDVATKNIRRTVVGIVVGHAAGAARAIVEFLAELAEFTLVLTMCESANIFSRRYAAIRITFG